MTQKNATTASEPPYSLSFDFSSPGGVEAVRRLLESIDDPESVFRVSIELESQEPFSPDTAVLGMGTQSAAQTSSESTSIDPDSEPSRWVDETEESDRWGPSDSEPVTEAEDTEDEESSSYTCDDCEETFDTPGEYRGHRRWCTAEEESTATEDGSDPAEGEVEPVTVSTGTWEYRVASLLAHTDEPLTAADAADRLEGTEWELPKGRLSTTMGQLYQNDIADRATRPSDGPGKDPFEYWLSDAGAEALEDAEDQAEAAGISTFPEVAPEEVETTDEGDSTTETVTEREEDAAETAEGTEDAEEAESEETEEGLSCDICGETFENKGALASHERYCSEEEENNEEKTPETVTLTPGTRRFRTAAVLRVLDKEPVVPREVEEALDGTPWEEDRSNLSSDLGELNSWGVTERSKREDETGQPYEYRLTDEGRERIEEAIEESYQDGTLEEAFPDADDIETADEVLDAWADSVGANAEGIDALFEDSGDGEEGEWELFDEATDDDDVETPDAATVDGDDAEDAQASPE